MYLIIGPIYQILAFVIFQSNAKASNNYIPASDMW